MAEPAHPCSRRADREGLMLFQPGADYALPPPRISQAVQQLRERMLREVLIQIAGYETATGRRWRLGDIVFGVQGDIVLETRTAKGAYPSTSADIMFSLAEEDPNFTGAERVTLNAKVTLKSEPAA